MGRPKKAETSLNRHSVSFMSHSQDRSVSPNENPELPKCQSRRSAFIVKISKPPLEPYQVTRPISPGPSKINYIQLLKEEENENQPKLVEDLSNISGESAPDKPTHNSPPVSYKANTCTTSIQPQVKSAALNNWTLNGDSDVIGTQSEGDILNCTPSSTPASVSNQYLSCHGLTNSSTASMSTSCCETELNPVMTSPIDQIQSITQSKDVSSSEIGAEIENHIQIDDVIEEISGDEMDSILESLKAHEKSNVNDNKAETWEPKAKKVKTEDNGLQECLHGSTDMNVNFPGIFNHTFTQKSYPVPVSTFSTSLSPPGNHHRVATPTCMYSGSQRFPPFNSYHGNTETVPFHRPYMGRPHTQVSTRQASNGNFLGFGLHRNLPPSPGSVGSVYQRGTNAVNSLSQLASNELKTSTVDERGTCVEHSTFNDSIRNSEVNGMQQKEIRYEIVNELKRNIKCYFEDREKYPQANNNKFKIKILF